MNRLRELRKARGLTLRQLNKLTGISDVNLSRYERGMVQPHENKWKVLADCYGVSILYLKGTDKEIDKYLESMVDTKFRLKELRIDNAELSRNELSKRTGISTSMIESIEIGRRDPGIKTLIALADYFDVSIDYLVGKSDVR